MMEADFPKQPISKQKVSFMEEVDYKMEVHN